MMFVAGEKCSDSGYIFKKELKKKWWWLDMECKKHWYQELLQVWDLNNCEEGSFINWDGKGMKKRATFQDEELEFVFGLTNFDMSV